ncbi:ATP-binding cassette domain-containing protein [bacterium]|nr:ATP-binding cassette domain-containing protein [bacterium]
MAARPGSFDPPASIRAGRNGDRRRFDAADPAVTVRNLDFSYEEAGAMKQVLFDIDLDIWPGEIVLLTGPSGCGKTTLLSLIGGLRTVQSGELTVLGHSLHGSPAGELVEVRRHIGFIFQMHNLMEFLTARQNVQMTLQLHPGLTRAEMEERANQALDEVGLGHRRAAYPANMSGGQKQRVSIARALVNHPRLVLADEPTSALDSKTGHEVIDILVRLAREQGCAILMVTHDTRISDMADRIIAMEDGHIISDE